MALTRLRISQTGAASRWARAALSCLCALATFWPAQVATAQVRLPTMGDAAAEELPVGVERRYGDQIMREVWRDPAYLDDPVLLDYLQSLWRPLVEAARTRRDIDDDLWAQFAWTVFLVQDRSVNAFALPGGFVGVHLGLIAMTSTQDELASVLAHELSHVTQRHIARSMASASRQSAVGMAAMLLGVLAASRGGSADVAQAAIVGSQAAVIQGQLNFSRDMEREADRIGYGIFSQAGYASAGMASMFEKLDHAGRLNDSGSFPYLRSHPLTIERMSEARSRLALASPGGRPASDVHAMMQARARVLMDTSETALRHHLAVVENGAGQEVQPGSLYAATLAAVLLKDGANVERLLPRLRQSISALTGAGGQAEWAVALLQAESLMARADPIGTARLLLSLRSSGSRAALLLQAQAAIQSVVDSSRPAESLLDVDQGLRAWLAEHRDDSAAWSLLARCAAAMGHELLSLRAQAEARAAQGDLPAAIDRLRAAQRKSRGAAGADFMDAAVIDARLKELEERRRSLAGPQTREAGRPPG